MCTWSKEIMLEILAKKWKIANSLTLYAKLKRVLENWYFWSKWRGLEMLINCRFLHLWFWLLMISWQNKKTNRWFNDILKKLVKEELKLFMLTFCYIIWVTWYFSTIRIQALFRIKLVSSLFSKIYLNVSWMSIKFKVLQSPNSL